jgi:hypothetical protein
VVAARWCISHPLNAPYLATAGPVDQFKLRTRDEAAANVTREVLHQSKTGGGGSARSAETEGAGRQATGCERQATAMQDFGREGEVKKLREVEIGLQ